MSCKRFANQFFVVPLINFCNAQKDKKGGLANEKMYTFDVHIKSCAMNGWNFVRVNCRVQTLKIASFHGNKGTNA